MAKEEVKEESRKWLEEWTKGKEEEEVIKERERTQRKVNCKMCKCMEEFESLGKMKSEERRKVMEKAINLEEIFTVASRKTMRRKMRRRGRNKVLKSSNI